MEFIITGLSGIYSFYSLANLKINMDKLKNDNWRNNKDFLEINESKDVNGISINVIEKELPMYFCIGFIGLPTTRNPNNDYKEIYNKFSSTNKDNECLVNWEFLDNYEKEYYINRNDSLQNFLKINRINDENLSLALPIKVKHAKFPNIYYTNFKTPLFSNKHHLISTDVNNLITESLIRKRMPFTFTSGIIFALGVGYIYNNNYYKKKLT